MRFIKSKESELHPNYVSRVIRIKEEDFSPHPHPDVTKLKCCRIGGDTIYNVIVSIDSKPGKYVFFPASTKINPEFLRYANLYRDPEMNSNPNKTGFFEENGRVKSLKLKASYEKTDPSTGVKENIFLPNGVSDGFLIELQVVLNFILDTFNIEVNENDIPDDTWFDTIEHEGKVCWLSKKFIPKVFTAKNKTGGDQSRYKRRQKKLKRFNRVIPEQFRFHYDSTLVKKVPFVVQPTDYIHISGKMHGSSVIFSYVLCKQQLNWKQKIAKYLTGYEFNKYDYLYASRTVIKNQYIMKEAGKTGNVYHVGFYGCDIWGEAFKIVKPHLIKGMSVYAEIVGYTSTNKYIQPDYDYGCAPLKDGEDYTYGKHFKIYVYRVTLTNVDGEVHEFSPREVQIWCKNNDLVAVPEYYYGKAKDLYPDLDITNHWHENFWNRMASDKNFYMEMDSPDCINKVPHEGVVIKIDDMIPRAFKLKSYRFCNKEEKELDAGITNIEDAQSENIDNDDSNSYIDEQ